jgi:hypothetical protein
LFVHVTVCLFYELLSCCFESVVYIIKIQRQLLSELHLCSSAFLCSYETTTRGRVSFNVPFLYGKIESHHSLRTLVGFHSSLSSREICKPDIMYSEIRLWFSMFLFRPYIFNNNNQTVLNIYSKNVYWGAITTEECEALCVLHNCENDILIRWENFYTRVPDSRKRQGISPKQ